MVSSSPIPCCCIACLSSSLVINLQGSNKSVNRVDSRVSLPWFAGNACGAGHKPAVIGVEELEGLEQVFFLLQSVAMHCGGNEFDIIDGPVFINIGLSKESTID